jgi:hypothetical protein
MPNVVENIIQVVDRSTSALTSIHKSAANLDRTLASVSRQAQQVGGIAGAFGIGQAVNETGQLSKSLERVHGITGAAAANARAMLDVFERSGVPLMHDEKTLLRIQTKMGAIVARAGDVTDEAKQQNLWFKKLGVEIQAGPTEALAGMARAAKAGQVGATDLARQMQIPIEQATKLMALLKQGPEELQRMTDVLKRDTAVVVGQMEQAQQRQAQRSVAERRRRMPERLLPGERLARRRPAAPPAVAAAAAAKKPGLLRRALGAITGRPAAPPAVAAAAAGKPAGMLKKGGAIIARIAKHLLVLGPIAVVVGLIVGGVVSIFRKFEGVNKLLRGVVDEFFKLTAEIGKLFGPDTPLGRFLRWMVSIILRVMKAFIFGVRVVVKMMELAMQGKFVGPAAAAHALRTAEKSEAFRAEAQKRRLQKAAPSWEKAARDRVKVTERVRRDFKQFREAAEKAGVAVSKAAIKRFGAPGVSMGAQVYQDFRGSRFDIRQDFAEGFDPDRVAAVFANELSDVGERRLQSGLAPIFTVR